MKRRYRSSLAALVLLVAVSALATPAFALQVPLHPVGRVNDFADILTANERKGIEEALAAHERSTTNQIVIATFLSLEGESLEDFSMRLAETWKIGQAGKDNGVIVSVYMQDRKARIEVGYGLEGALPDVVCKRILDEELTPRFREKDYAGGLRAVVARIGVALGDTALAGMDPPVAVGRRDSRGGDTALSLAAILFLALFMFILVVISVTAGKRGGRRGSWSSGGGGGYRSSGGFSGGGFSGGGGSFGGGGSSGSW